MVIGMSPSGDKGVEQVRRQSGWWANYFHFKEGPADGECIAEIEYRHTSIIVISIKDDGLRFGR